MCNGKQVRDNMFPGISMLSPSCQLTSPLTGCKRSQLHAAWKRHLACMYYTLGRLMWNLRIHSSKRKTIIFSSMLIVGLEDDFLFGWFVGSMLVFQGVLAFFFFLGGGLFFFQTANQTLLITLYNQSIYTNYCLTLSMYVIHCCYCDDMLLLYLHLHIRWRNTWPADNLAWGHHEISCVWESYIVSGVSIPVNRLKQIGNWGVNPYKRSYFTPSITGFWAHLVISSQI